MEKNGLNLKSDNINLVGEIYLPDTGEKQYPAICFCHGIPAVPYNPNEPGYSILAEKFCAEGFITLIFNFRGTGLSEGNLDLLGWSRDLKAAIDCLRTLDEVDKSHLSLIGFSGGAAVSIYHAATDAGEISSVIALACPAYFHRFSPNDQGESLIEHFRNIGVIRDKGFPSSAEDWVKGFTTIAPVQWIDKISPHPLLLIHGDKDDVVPIEHCFELYKKANEPKNMAVIPGAEHRLRAEEKAINTALNWLKGKFVN